MWVTRWSSLTSAAMKTANVSRKKHGWVLIVSVCQQVSIYQHVHLFLFLFRDQIGFNWRTEQYKQVSPTCVWSFCLNSLCPLRHEHHAQMTLANHNSQHYMYTEIIGFTTIHLLLWITAKDILQHNRAWITEALLKLSNRVIYICLKFWSSWQISTVYGKELHCVLKWQNCIFF